ncbi:hypothetical protein EDD86DRAFT_15615 [Gorgonomyces haynaldii]|nr:hypothetical protein EDD86DRAFT_15615 [Gorgonomyces haynaldii]
MGAKKPFLTIQLALQNGKMSINGLTLERNSILCTWTISKDATLMEVPSQLKWFLQIFHKFNTMRLENSRRLIVSLIVHTAVSMVDNGNLRIDEELNLEIIKETTRESNDVTVKYHGMLDIVVGYSGIRGEMPKDAALLVVEVKTGSTYEDGFKQALAQAATFLEIRREHKKGHDGNGGPVYFIVSNGIRWRFATLDWDGDHMAFQDTEDMHLSFVQSSSFNESTQKMFSVVVEMIKLCEAASPRVSSVRGESFKTSPPGRVMQQSALELL